jgi:phage terminase large subunit GpA-like protein
LRRENAIRKQNLPPELRLLWKPPDDISVPDWVEKNIRLTEKMSAEPGPLRISRTPYIRGPLDALGSPWIEEVVLVWGRQLSKSTGVQYSFLCYCIAQDPGPATFLLPVRDKALEISETKLQPIFEACEEVRCRKPSNPDNYTKSRMDFTTMVLAMGWGGSESQTTSRSNRYLFVDEADEIKKSIGQNAIDPLKGIMQTTTTYPNRKIIMTSTPTTPEGNIWQGLKTCRYVFEYWLPCPHCGAFQILYWENVKFGEDHDPVVVEEMAYYECEACQEHISNLDKIRMLTRGEWRARMTQDAPGQIMKNIRATITETLALDTVLQDRRVKKIGFHLPKWYSPFSGGTLGVIAKEFLEAEKSLREGEDFAPMRNWRIYNAARPWEEVAASQSELELMNNRIEFATMVCPPQTIAISCGIDPSEGGFFFSVLAWHVTGDSLSPHLVQYGELMDFEEISKFLKLTVYPTEDGKMKQILVTGLDTGGGEYDAADTTMTEAAYIWLRQMRSLGVNVFGTKGMSHPMKMRAKQSKVEKMPGKAGKPIPGGLVLWEINTLAMKDVLWFHLGIEEGKPGRFTFHNATEADYIKQLLSEKKVMQKNGKWEWERHGKNHWLDATLIALTLMERDAYGLQVQAGSTRTARRTISKGVE